MFGLVQVNDALASPAAWALAPVVGTAAVIVAGVASEQRTLFPLVNPVANYIGGISYSLYLWHWPAAILVLTYYPDVGWRHSLLVVVVTGAAAIFSFKAVEDPVRRSSWLDPGPRDRLVRRRWEGINAPAGLARSWAVAATFVVVAATIAGRDDPAVLSAPPPPPTVPRCGVPNRPQSVRSPSGSSDALSARSMRLTSRCSSLGWTTSDCQWAQEVDERVCFDVSESVAAECVFGEARCPANGRGAGRRLQRRLDGRDPRRAARPTDSESTRSPGSQCPAWDVALDPTTRALPSATPFGSGPSARSRGFSPDLLIISSYHYLGYEIDNVGDTDGAVAEAVESGPRPTLARAGPATSTVSSRRHRGREHAGVCDEHRLSRGLCSGHPGDLASVSRAESSASEAAGATYIDTSGWFCSPSRCPAFVGSTPVTVDGAHISWKFSTDSARSCGRLRKAEVVPAAALR